MSERVFVDTSAYYALTDRSDANHASAVARAHQFSLEGADLFTSNYVVAETHTLILNRLGHDIAVQVLEHLYASATRIIRATETDERRGREIVVQHRDKAYSLADAISFAIMERLHLPALRLWSGCICGWRGHTINTFASMVSHSNADKHELSMRWGNKYSVR